MDRFVTILNKKDATTPTNPTTNEKDKATPGQSIKQPLVRLKPAQVSPVQVLQQ